MPPSVVHLSDVKFRWRPENPLTLDVPGFELTAGECLFVYGPSGSGKTTLLNLVAGVANPEHGEVRVLDQSLAQLPTAHRDAFRSDHIGLIFQMFNLVPYLSVVENILLPCRFSARRRDRAVANDGSLDAAASRLLGDLELDFSRLGSRTVSELSVGQQQRVAAARALIGAPELIIADEPTSSLDADVQQAFLDLLFNEVKQTGAALLFVSHDRRLEPRFTRSVSLTDINNAVTPSLGPQLSP